MSCIYVETKTNKYPIYFTNGFSDLKAAVEETGLSGRKLCLIADSNTGKLYAEKVKKELIALIRVHADEGEQAVDLLMVTKYFERIGDHATNIAEWVIFSITGQIVV